MSKVTRPDSRDQARADFEAKFLSLRSIRYDAKTDAISLELSSGVFVGVPRKQIRELKAARPDQLSDLYAGNGGATISQDDLDVDIFVPGLLDELFGSTIRADLGRRAGRATSPAKARAARRNGRKGGRPPKRAA